MCRRHIDCAVSHGRGGYHPPASRICGAQFLINEIMFFYPETNIKISLRFERDFIKHIAKQCLLIV